MRLSRFSKPVFLLLSMALAACSSDAPCIQYIECPDGDCEQQAKEICPAGYETKTESDVGSDFGEFARLHFPGAASGVPHLIVTCH